jgi:hypothetical protein
MSKAFHELTEREILALAITLEEEDGRIYGEFAERNPPTGTGCWRRTRPVSATICR